MLRDANIRSEQRVEVKNGDTLKSGDKFEIQIKCNADVYAYLFFIDSSGATTELFAGKLSGGELKIENLKMDTATGQETAFLLISKKPIANFRKKIGKFKNKEVGTVEQLFPGVITKIFQIKHE